MVQEFGDSLKTDGQVLFCKKRSINVNCEKKSQIIQHARTKRHKESATKSSTMQTLIANSLIEKEYKRIFKRIFYDFKRIFCDF